MTMQRKCDKCGRPATYYVTDIKGGEKVERNLCEECAISEGYAAKAEVPISKLLEDFILQGGGSAGGEGESESDEGPVCDVCGTSYGEFASKKQLGCPHDYDVFAERLEAILANEHDGATQHIGKVPHRAGSDQKKQNAILRLRAQLRSAIAVEDYERAAALRDQIKELEQT